MSKCKNCMGGCIHSKSEKEYKSYELDDGSGNTIITGSEFVGFKDFCDIHPDAYNDWHKRNEHKTYEEYKTDELECYEPTEYVRLLGEMNDTLDGLLDKLNEKK